VLKRCSRGASGAMGAMSGEIVDKAAFFVDEGCCGGVGAGFD